LGHRQWLSHCGRRGDVNALSVRRWDTSSGGSARRRRCRAALHRRAQIVKHVRLAADRFDFCGSRNFSDRGHDGSRGCTRSYRHVSDHALSSGRTLCLPLDDMRRERINSRHRVHFAAQRLVDDGRHGRHSLGHRQWLSHCGRRDDARNDGDAVAATVTASAATATYGTAGTAETRVSIRAHSTPHRCTRWSSCIRAATSAAID
jgi:hypothetical protein